MAARFRVAGPEKPGNYISWVGTRVAAIFRPLAAPGSCFPVGNGTCGSAERGSLALTPPRAVRYARLLTRSSVKPVLKGASRLGSSPQHQRGATRLVSLFASFGCSKPVVAGTHRGHRCLAGEPVGTPSLPAGRRSTVTARRAHRHREAHG